MSSFTNSQLLHPQLKLFDAAVVSETSPHAGGLSSRMSLAQFWLTFVKPCFLLARNDSALTIEEYQQSIDYWILFTGDPPLDTIDDFATARFASGIFQLPGRKSATISTATVRKHYRNIQCCLDLAGPRSARSPASRKAQRLIDDVPYLDKPSLELDPVTTNFTVTEIGQIIGATRQMRRPLISGLAAADFWFLFVVVSYNTSEREGAMMTVELPPPGAVEVHFPRSIRKGRRKSMIVPLNAAAREAIETTRSARALLCPFPRWPHSRRWFLRQWHRLVRIAGISAARNFAPHALRRSTATEAAQIDPKVAQLLLGHGSMKTTIDHYVNQSQMRSVLDRLPQPPPRAPIDLASNVHASGDPLSPLNFEI
jgi:hypothetical protein